MSRPFNLQTTGQTLGIFAMLGIVTFVVLLAIVAWYQPMLRATAAAGTGLKSKLLCSAVFVAGRDPQEVLAAEAGAGALSWIDASIDHPAQQVTASLLWASARSVHVPGVGCIRQVRETAPTLKAKYAPAPAAPDRADAPWPTGDMIDPALRPAFDAAALTAAIDTAFAEDDPARPRRTRAVAVVWRGQLIAERYAPGFGPETPLIGWSMTKSITNALIGMRVEDGALALHAAAPIPEWANDERAAITLDQLLRMSSGLAFSEVYDDLTSDAVMMLFGEHGHAMGRYAASKPLAHAPDTVWSYSSGTTNILTRIFLESFETPREALIYARERLLDRIGMTRTVIEPDESGAFVGSSFGYGPARDWARFGLLFLQRGRWQGDTLLSADWVDYSTTPTPAAPMGQYGAQWWLNAGEPGDPGQRPWPELPPDAYRASGFEGQSVMVIPSRDLVVVRLGYTIDRSAFRIGPFVAGILAALDTEPPAGKVASAL